MNIKMDDRVLKLENEIKELKDKLSVNDKKREKKPRAQSEYNLFMSKKLKELKEKLGDKYNHKDAFKQAASSWKKQKE
tara:strand:+ start:718 stop:951 length:234 start_codon:yes stop_codon:yes gene_type:complete